MTEPLPLTITCWECPIPDGRPRCNLSGRCPVATLPIVAALIEDALTREATT